MKLCNILVVLQLMQLASGVLGKSLRNQIRKLPQNDLRTANVTCLLLMKYTEFDGNPSGSEEEWNCELDESVSSTGFRETVTIRGIPPVWANENAHRMISGDSYMEIVGAQLDYGKNIFIPPGRDPSIVTGNGNTNKKGYGDKYGNFQTRRRRLATTEGIKAILVARVIAEDASATATVQEISDSIFGTSGDLVNLKSQYGACSHNKLTIVPASAGGQGIVDGVVDVDIPYNVTGGDENVIKNYVTARLEQMGFTAGSTENYQHIMYCLPPGIGGTWIGFTYGNSWNSVYNDLWCNSVTLQMHEIGHNLDLGHSAYQGNIRGDTSGAMGGSYNLGDLPKVCFNAAKSWQIGWYSDKTHSIDPLAGSWTGKICGVTHYQTNLENSDAPIVILKINTDTDVDYYVNFNRREGMNDGTQRGGDQVTIVSQGGEGSASAQSNLEAMLGAEGTYTILDFNNPGSAVTVTVNEINMGVSTPYACVSVCAAGMNCPTSCDLCSGVNCDDGDACTVDTCTDGVCSNTPISCDDGDLCTSDTCDAGVCTNSLSVFCNDGDECTNDFCVSATGLCESVPVDCDDGNVCTVDSCNNGVCSNVPNPNCCTDDSECDDGDVCTSDQCQNNSCVNTLVSGCPLATCGVMAGCQGANDGGAENCSTCPSDCRSGVVPGASCGNGLCEGGNGESSINCSTDCAGITSGNPGRRFYCGDYNGAQCQDQRCDSNGYQCTMATVSSGTTCCGDGVCEGDENESNCATDCDLCGNNICDVNAGETVANCVDCVCDADGICESWEDAISCPNDCGICGDSGAACTLDTDCCSTSCPTKGKNKFKCN